MITNSRTRTTSSATNDERRNTTHRRKKVATIAGIGIGSIGLMAAPAAADRPIEFEDSFAFVAVNPCTDAPVEITIDTVIRVHEHGDGFVAHVTRTGSTDDGYVMDHGVETALFNGNVFRQSLTDTFRNEDGSKFQAQGVLVEQGDGVRIDRLVVRCLGR